MPKVKICMIPKDSICEESISEKYNGDFIVISKIKFTYLNKQEHMSFDSHIKIKTNMFSMYTCFINHLMRHGKYTHDENKLKLYPKVYADGRVIFLYLVT